MLNVENCLKDWLYHKHKHNNKMQENELEFHVFTVYAKNDSDFDKLFERVRPEIVNSFELINPNFTRVEVNFKREPDQKPYKSIVDHYDDDYDGTYSADILITRTVKVLRSIFRYSLRDGLQSRFDYMYKDIYDRRFDESISPEERFRAMDNGDWDGEEGLENTGLYGSIVKFLAKDMESEVSYITIKMLNADKHYHKSNFYKSLHDELMPIAWHPDRAWDWCFDNEQKGEAEQLWT